MAENSAGKQSKGKNLIAARREVRLNFLRDFCQGPWNVDLRTPPGPEGSNGSLLCIRRGHPGTLSNAESERGVRNGDGESGKRKAARHAEASRAKAGSPKTKARKQKLRPPKWSSGVITRHEAAQTSTPPLATAHCHWALST